MDLHEWITTDLAALRSRLFDGVVARVPPPQWSVGAGGSSLDHLLLHLARHQDLAVQTAIRNRPPLFAAHAPSLGLEGAGSAAGLSEREDLAATAAIHTDALRGYVEEVFEATGAWLERVGTMALDTVPDVARRFREHAGLDVGEVGWLYSMWAGRPVWWLVQWPVLGHGHTHAGEATGQRNRLGYSPF